MPTVYEIEGDLITRVTRTIDQVGRLSDLLPSLTTYKPIEVGSLPRDCSYIRVEPTPEDTVSAQVIVAQPPQIRRILFNESHGATDRRTAYSIAIPWALFFFKMHGTPQPNVNAQGARISPMLWAPTTWGTAWMRRQPQSIATDMAVTAHMPNTWGDGRVCFGNNPVDANQTLGQYINGLINTYWTSLFNTDLGVRTPYGATPRSSLNQWQRDTSRSPDAWQHWNIWAIERPIHEIIANVDAANWADPVPDSVEPVVPMPPRAYTFFSIRQWLLTDFTEEQRNRMLWALTNADIEATPEAPDERLDTEDAPPDSERLDTGADRGEPVGSELGEGRPRDTVDRTDSEPEAQEPADTAPALGHVFERAAIRPARRTITILDTDANPFIDSDPNQPRDVDG